MATKKSTDSTITRMTHLDRNDDLTPRGNLPGVSSAIGGGPPTRYTAPKGRRAAAVNAAVKRGAIRKD